MSGVRRWGRLVAGPAVGIGVVFFLMRWWLLSTPRLSEAYYDEALTGLMSLAILRGVHEVFYWGEPYGGAVGDAYLAAAGFGLFGPSTFVLRMAPLAIGVLWAWALWCIGRRIGGPRAGLVAGLLLAVPPVFLSYVQLYSQGEGVAMALGALALAAAARLVDPAKSRRGEGAAWALLGLAGGFGWWASQMMAMCLAAAAVGVLGARRRILREPGPYVALALFALSSLPFWIWNREHDWVTFRHFTGWGPPLPEVYDQAVIAGRALLSTLLGAYWDAHVLRLPSPVRYLGWALVLTVYIPAVGLAAVRLGRWAARLGRGERPWQEPLDVVVLAFWLTVIAHLTTSFGAQGILRYAITFYATLPVLCAAWIGRLANGGRARQTAALVLAGALLGFNFLTHALFVHDAAGDAHRPVDAAIARLQALGIRACYADSRIAQVITFESGERLQCADYYGLRNFDLLRAVNAVDDPASVAIVTHRRLEIPDPDVMAATLELMGVGARRDEVGDYVIFHHFQPPDPRLHVIPPEGWTARASTQSEDARRAFDRQVWTRWQAPKEPGQWFELDLGRVHQLAQVTLESGSYPADGPAGLRVETSPDGRVWDIAAQAAELLTGMHWWKGHPRVDDSGRVIVRMQPRPARFVRLIQTGSDHPGILWSLAEIFAYEPAETAERPAPEAAAAYETAVRELAHWMDDPWGPHPKRTPASYAHRKAQVPWAAVFEAVSQALERAPEWEEAHHLYAQTLQLWQWSGDLDIEVARARKEGAWQALMPWAQQADMENAEFWRSGRTEARLEALVHLGRRSEAEALRAEAVRAEASRRPEQSLRARFENGIELTGVTLPAAARRGQELLVRFGWRATRRVPEDYTVFVHLDSPGRRLIQDHVLGGAFGSSEWAPGERTVETVTVVIAEDAPPGVYRVRVGLWRPGSRRRVGVVETDLPHDRVGVIAGTVTVVE